MKVYTKFKSKYLNSLFFADLWSQNKDYTNRIIDKYYRDCDLSLSGESVIQTIKNSEYFHLFIRLMNELKIEYIYFSSVHGIKHIERTCILTMYMAYVMGLSEKDIRICVETAKYHDIGREDDTEDAGYGYRGAVQIKGMDIDFCDDDKCVIAAVIAAHSVDDGKCENIFEKFKVKSKRYGECKKYLKILKDADALDRFRLNENSLKVRYLRNQVALKMVKAACEIAYYDECTEPYKLNWVRLPLQKAYNVRELGGYPTKFHRQTRYHRFLRSDNLYKLTDRDISFLLGYGVSCVIDLRSDNEAEYAPNCFEKSDKVKYFRYQLMSDDLADVSKLTEDKYRLGLSYIYIEMLKNKEAVRNIFSAMADTQEGCIIFHCSSGKDRTGVVAMLLMLLVGVDKCDCITNYEQSYVNMWRKEGYKNNAKKEYGDFVYSLPETMNKCIDMFLEKYKSVDKYLIECGLSRKQIENIRCHFIE